MRTQHYLHNLQCDESSSYGVTRGNHQKSHSTSYTTRFMGQAVENLRRTRSSNAREARQTAHYDNIDDLSIGVAPIPSIERMQHVFSPAIAAPICNASAVPVDEAMDDVFGMRFAADDRYSYLFEHHRKLDAEPGQNYSQATQAGGVIGSDLHSNYALDSGVPNSDTSLSRASSSPFSRPSSSSSTASFSHGYRDGSLVEARRRQFSHGGKRNIPSRSNESLVEAEYRAKIKPVNLALAPAPRLTPSSKVPLAPRTTIAASLCHSRSGPLSSISSTKPCRMPACKGTTRDDLMLISTRVKAKSELLD